MSHFTHHPAHFALAPFGEHERELGYDGPGLQHTDAQRPRQPVLELDPGRELANGVLADDAGGFHPVLALDLAARMLDTVGELALIGEQQQPFGIPVEPAHVSEPESSSGRTS